MAYREYTIRVLTEAHGPDATDTLRDAVLETLLDEFAVAVIRVATCRDVQFSDLPLGIAERITEMEKSFDDSDDDATEGRAS